MIIKHRVPCEKEGVWVSVYHGAHVEVRRQTPGVGHSFTLRSNTECRLSGPLGRCCTCWTTMLSPPPSFPRARGWNLGGSHIGQNHPLPRSCPVSSTGTFSFYFHHPFQAFYIQRVQISLKERNQSHRLYSPAPQVNASPDPTLSTYPAGNPS